MRIGDLVMMLLAAWMLFIVVITTIKREEGDEKGGVSKLEWVGIVSVVVLIAWSVCMIIGVV
jgi:hypothetical protein